VILYGNKEKGIEDVRQKIEDWVDGTTDARGHKVRKDANALLAGVISWPPINEGEDKKGYFDRLESFQSAMLLWLRKEYGSDLVLVLRHDDELFRGLNAGKIHHHWHYFCVKKPGEKFKLHPGFAARSAKDISRQEKKGMNGDEIRAAMSDGRKAYLEAMSAFQDRFHQELGKFYGLDRMGPRRLRRSRSEQVEYEALLEQQIVATKDAMDKATIIVNNAAKDAERITQIAEAKAKDLKSEAIALKNDAQKKKNEADALKAKADSEKKEAEKKTSISEYGSEKNYQEG